MAENLLFPGRWVRYNKGTMKPAKAFACAAVCALAGAAFAFLSPNTANVRPLSGVTRLTIKGYAPQSDGIKWLHGVALCFHGDRLYASFGINTGAENTCGECLHIRSSDDGGVTWSASSVVASGSSVHGVSHGSLASVDGTLWAFAGSFSNGCSFVHTRAYRMEASGEWTEVGPVIGGGFWPMQNPIRLPDGNWIMGGLRATSGWNAVGGNRPAVAISEGNDFTKWRVIVPEGDMPAEEWGESTVDLKNGVLTLTSRPGWGESPMVAHTATSADNGLTWTALKATEMKIVTAKPFTGTLSDGRRYLISTITSDGGERRSPLMIAWSAKGKTDYSYAASFATGVSSARLSYASAVEKDGKLYIGYSDNGGRGGNLNSAELAVMPLKSLDDYQKAAEESPRTAVVAVSDDTMVYSSLTEQNYGKLERMLAGVNTADGRFGRALLRFSDFDKDARQIAVSGGFNAILRVCFSKVPASSGSGTLWKYNTTDRVPLRLYLLSDDDCDWREGDHVDDVASAGECCWDWLAKDQRRWSDAGLQPDRLVEIASVEVGPVSSFAAGEPIDIPITSNAGRAAIAKWAKGGMNAGLLLVGKEVPTSDGYRTVDLYSKDQGNDAYWPRLILKDTLADIACSADSFFYSPDNYADRDWGGDPVLCIGRNNETAVYRAILKFDVAGDMFQKALADRTLTGAKLTLTVAEIAKKGSGKYKLRLHLLNDKNAGWGEGTHSSANASGTKASPGDGCWNYCAYNTRAWVGGPGIGIDSSSDGIDETAAEVEIDASAIAKGSKIVFDLQKKSVLRRISQWITGGANAGFYLTTDENGAAQAAVQIASRENGNYSGPTLDLYAVRKQGLALMIY